MDRRPDWQYQAADASDLRGSVHRGAVCLHGFGGFGNGRSFHGPAWETGRDRRSGQRAGHGEHGELAQGQGRWQVKRAKRVQKGHKMQCFTTKTIRTQRQQHRSLAASSHCQLELAGRQPIDAVDLAVLTTFLSVEESCLVLSCLVYTRRCHLAVDPALSHRRAGTSMHRALDEHVTSMYGPAVQAIGGSGVRV